MKKWAALNWPHGVRRSRRGFTLVELLVVIAIIGILAAILFPVFASAREKGRQAACESNLHQCSLACMQYIQDNDEYYPRALVNESGSVYGYVWCQQIWPYIQNVDVFLCPTAPQLQVVDLLTEAHGGYYVNVGMNNTTFGTGNSTIGSLFFPSYKLPHPELMFMIMDSQPPPGVTTDNPAIIVAQTYNLTNRHSGGCNIAFADGHVKWEPSGFYSNNNWTNPASPVYGTISCCTSTSQIAYWDFRYQSP